MSIAEKLNAVAQNQQEIEMQYFKTSFIGSGTGIASFAIPFEPDIVEIIAFPAMATGDEKIYQLVTIDTRATTYWSALGVRSVQSTSNANVFSPTLATVPASTAHGGAFTYENGVFTWNMTIADYFFSPYVRYYVLAARFPNHSRKQMIEEEVALLPDTPPNAERKNLRYNKALINSVFTTEEWAALTATKPNWNFVLQ